MITFEDTRNPKDSPCNLEGILEAIKLVLGLDDASLVNLDDKGANVFRIIYLNSPVYFEIFELREDVFSLAGYNSNHCIIDDYFNDIESFKACLEAHKDELYGSTASFDRDDEEEQEAPQSKGGSEDSSNLSGIVNGDITKIRVVALKSDGVVIAYRFKTNLGAFDMRKSTATKYGLGGYKTDKFITLEHVNGLLMSKNELKARVCVPDISECEEDCKKLVNALFTCGVSI